MIIPGGPAGEFATGRASEIILSNGAAPGTGLKSPARVITIIRNYDCDSGIASLHYS
ncbi:hypothetical protein IH879_16685 [candidate division KSB1 bacterium]|nr:hypothetical protein [candidate division KSB1 bacterium]